MPSLTCPECGKHSRKILDSRLSAGGYTVYEYVWRRNICKSCKHKYTTIELPLQTLKLLMGEEEESEREGDTI